MTQALGNLDDVGLAHGTDKASDEHDYLTVYDRYLRPKVESGPGSLLELGWWTGSSMRMWREWLPENWSVSGLDIDAKEEIDGVNFIHGDQASREIADDAAESYGPWDVIVDDASHISPLTVASFHAYWPHLKSGGLYIVEDLQVSYHTNWQGNPNPDLPGSHGQTSMQFLKNLVDDVHFGHASSGPESKRLPHSTISHMSFYPALCIIEKA